MDLNLYRSDLAAKHRNLGHPRHGEEAQAHRPVGDGSQVHEAFCRGRQAGHEDGAARRGERREDGRLHAGGQLLRRIDEALCDDLPIEVDVAARDPNVYID